MRGLDIDKDILNESIEPNKKLSGNHSEKELIDKFNIAIASIKEKFQLLELDNISEELKLNILRSQISLLLSAVDFYIHEIIRIELLNIIQGERKQTPSLKNCLISVQTLLDYLSSSDTNNQLLEAEIVHRNSFKSFLEPDNMAEGLSLIYSNKDKNGTKRSIFKILFSEFNLSGANELKKKMKKIYERRNDIVHQLDYNYSNKIQQTITKKEVEEYINFYEKFINKLHLVLLEENI